MFGGIAWARSFIYKSMALSAADAVYCYRIGFLRVGLGIMGVVLSFAFLSSIFSIAGGAVTIATMRSLDDATAITQNKKRSWTNPARGAYLAIAAILVGVAELLAMATLMIASQGHQWFDSFYKYMCPLCGVMNSAHKCVFACLTL